MDFSFLISVLSYYLLCHITLVDSIMFHLQPNSQKCIREEIRSNELVIGEIEVTEFPGQKVDYIVTDSKRNTLAAQEDVKKNGKFTFVTENYEVFEVCFKSKASHPAPKAHEVLLKFKRSSEARNLEGLAEASMLKPMEVELKHLEYLVDSIVSDFVEMRQREKEMRDTNESTTNRVQYLSIFSIAVLLSLAVWQVLYLKKFFKSKKLIE